MFHVKHKILNDYYKHVKTKGYEQQEAIGKSALHS